MKVVRKLAAASVVLALVTPWLAYASEYGLHADLTADREVPPKDSAGHGELTGSYDSATKMLMWHVTYSDLTGPASMAHFHGPALPGKNAPVVIPVPMDQLPSPMDGMATLNDVQEKDLLSGNWYFNIHTAKNPSGEIRGQVEVMKK